MTIAEWVKANATLKDGVSIKDLEVLAKDLDPLKNITNKEAAADFIDRNGFFKSALDSAVSKAVLSHDERFTSEKLPEILKAEKEKMAKELNPEETPEQKRLRELEDKLSGAEKREKDNQLKSELRLKAKEIGFDMDSDKYSVYGDKAVDMMLLDKKAIDDRIEATKKEFYKDNHNPKKTDVDPEKVMTRSDFAGLSPQGQSDFIVKNGGVVTD